MTVPAATNLDFIREFRSELLSELTKFVSSATIQAAAKRLRLWHDGQVQLDEEDSTAGLTFLQYCVLDFARTGTTALDRYRFGNAPPEGSDKERFLDALAEASFTIHKVTNKLSDNEVELEDVSNGDLHVVREDGFWKKATVGTLIATRLVNLGDVVITSGVFFGLSAADPDDETPPRIPPVANKAQALQRTEALLQQLLAHRNDPVDEAPRELSDKELA
jgi:hypothetical protein